MSSSYDPKPRASSSTPETALVAGSAADAPAPKKPTWKRRLVRSVVVYGVIPYVGVIILVAACQRWLIYQPKKTDRLLAKEVVGAEMVTEDVALHAANGLTLNGWRFHASAAPDLQSLLVLYFPGNAGCRADRVGDCRDFTQLGCDVVLFDYRGYGDNKGSCSEELLASDARRAWMFATRDLHYPPERIVLFGESLGGAVATRLAAEFCKVGEVPAALILNSTFDSLGDTAAWHYPAFPFRYLLLDRFPSIKRIPSVTCPILQFHGTADDIVGFHQGKRLFDAAPEKSWNGVEKVFVAIPDGQHNYITMSDLHAEVVRFFEAIKRKTSDK